MALPMEVGELKAGPQEDDDTHVPTSPVPAAGVLLAASARVSTSTRPAVGKNTSSIASELYD